MAPDSAEAVLELKRAFVCEALDVAKVHLAWTTEHLIEGRDLRAIEAFEKFLASSREAASEMKAIRAAIEEKALTAASVVEFRAQRRPPSQPGKR